MSATHDQPSPGTQPPSFWRSRHAVGFVVFGGITAYFLLSEHRAHFFGALPYLLLLACPLLHFFMHAGHGGDAHGSGDAGRSTPARPSRSGDRS